MADSPSIVVSTGPARGLVGGVARHMLILEEIAQHLPVRLDYFQIGRRPEEKGAWAQLRRLVVDYLEFARRLKTAKAEGGPVVAHVNSSVRPVCVVRDGGFVLLSRLLRVPVIYQVHGCMLHGPDDGRTWLRRITRWVLNLSDRVVVLSPAQSRAIGGRAAMAAVAVNNAVFMEPVPERTPGGHDPFRILYLARFVPEKGVMQCLDAMKILRDRGVPVRLQLCGAGPLESEIPGRIAALGLQDCVELVGRVPAEQTRAKLAENDLLWLPSQHPEGQPYVLMEALEAGMPAMISRAGEVVGDMIDGAAKRGGALIEAQPTGASFAELTEALVRDRARYQALVEAARREAEATYSMEAVLPKWQQVWNMAQPVGAAHEGHAFGPRRHHIGIGHSTGGARRPHHPVLGRAWPAQGQRRRWMTLILIWSGPSRID